MPLRPGAGPTKSTSASCCDELVYLLAPDFALPAMSGRVVGLRSDRGRSSGHRTDLRPVGYLGDNTGNVEPVFLALCR